MKGTVFSINISSKKGTKKHPVSAAMLLAGKGLKNDAHSNTQRQVSFLGWESAKKLQKRSQGKIRVHPGIFAENITTTGINWRDVSVGDEVYIGKSILKVTEIGKECHRGCIISKVVGSCIMPKEGVFAEVIKGGIIKKGDIIKIINPKL